MEARAGSRYHEVYGRSLREPEAFWADAARAIDWYEPAKKVFDPDAGVYGRWFVGATCNTCHNDKTPEWASEALRKWPGRSPWRVE